MQAIRCTKCGEAKPATPQFFTRTRATRVGVTQPCRDCHKARMRIDNRLRYASNREQALLRTYATSDRRAGRENNLTAEWVAANITSKPCFYCGTEDDPRGCDRIDNAIGHVESNVIPSCKICNKARNDLFSVEEMVRIGGVIRQIREDRKVGRLSSKLRRAEGGRILFWCPGCDGAHQVQIGEGPGPRWDYNGNAEAPAFTPSILVQGIQPLTDEERDVIIAGGKIEKRPLLCHSFVTNGRIQFLGDCTHALAGQTVDLPDFEEA